VLRVENVVFAYPGAEMRFDLEVPRGEICAVIGPSGSGKTTLLALIAGFERPASGRILFDGIDITPLPPSARPVTMLFQDHNLFAHLDAGANVGLGIHPGLRLGADDRRRVAEALARVGLDGLGHRLPRELSGGQRQRVALARALVQGRPLLLLDEPFAALGPALRFEMLDLVDGLRRREGLTVLLVSHQIGDAQRIADRTAFLDEGRIVACAPTKALLADPPEALGRYLGTG
jgi:thiamine transport system ATP-binding protein